MMLLKACTVSISVVDTHGKAEDVVDTDQEPKNDIKTELDITPGL